MVYGMSASCRHGEPFSTRIVIKISGEQKDGTACYNRYELIYPKGQEPVTALGVALGIECLDGNASAAPGLYFH